MNQDVKSFLLQNESQIRKHVNITDMLWENLLKRVPSQAATETWKNYDEQAWTFMITANYALEGISGIEKLCRILTNDQLGNVSEEDKIWIEALPLPPRLKEGNTNIDLAIGNIQQRQLGSSDTTSKNSRSMAVQWRKGSGFILFAEMKWYSDIDTKVTHDLCRNQLARVVENALFFCDDSDRADIYVTLVTPKLFRDEMPRSRFYWYKYNDYAHDKNTLIDDLSSSTLSLRNIKLDVLIERIERLKLNWISFEEFLSHSPSSVLKSYLEEIMHACKTNTYCHDNVD